MTTATPFYMVASDTPNQSTSDAGPNLLLMSQMTPRPADTQKRTALHGSFVRPESTVAPERDPAWTPVMRIQPQKPPAFRFDLRQQWEGIVQSITEESIWVVLRDLTHPEHPAEEATLLLEDVSPEDRPLIAPGAVLYWNIGYETSRETGQVSRVSSIRFRRLPVWSRRDLERVEKRALKFLELFSDENDDTAHTTSIG